MYDLTTYFSSTRDMIGVIEMGLKSLGCDGWLTLGTGVITAAFHCCGTTPAAMDKLKRFATGATKTGAPSLRKGTMLGCCQVQQLSVAACPRCGIPCTRTQTPCGPGQSTSEQAGGIHCRQILTHSDHWLTELSSSLQKQLGRSLPSFPELHVLWPKLSGHTSGCRPTV